MSVCVCIHRSVQRVLIPEPPKPPSLLHALHQLFKSTSHVSYLSQGKVENLVIVIIFIQLYFLCFQDHWTFYVSKLVEYMLSQTNPHRLKALCDIMSTLVSQSVIPPRYTAGQCCLSDVMISFIVSTMITVINTIDPGSL